jgi:hypothetical protein
MMNDLLQDVVDLAQDHGPAVVAFLATVVGAGWFWQLLARAAEVRRDGYAEAMKTLVAFQEFPYRIRRRTSDEPEVLAALAERGHDMQERLAYWQLWLDTEHKTLGRTYRTASTSVRNCITPYVRDAWQRPPVTIAANMVIATGDNPIPYDLSPANVGVENFRSEARWRFGWRRPVGVLYLSWRRWTKK